MSLDQCSFEIGLKKVRVSQVSPFNISLVSSYFHLMVYTFVGYTVSLIEFGFNGRRILNVLEVFKRFSVIRERQEIQGVLKLHE